MRGFLAILVTVVVLGGCATFDVGRYGVSVENNAALKKLGGSKVAVGPGEWMLDLTVTSSNGQSLTVANKYTYGFTYIGETACARTAKSFAPAVQLLIGKLVHDPKFGDLLK